MRLKAGDASVERLSMRIAAAKSQVDAEVVIKNAQILDVFAGGFYRGDIAICDGVIVGVQESYAGMETIDASQFFAVPGFIDAHVHIESSLITPLRFQEAVLPLGTTTAFWDPHEIANVKGEEGVDWALKEAERLLMDVFVLLPSCVPATHMETAGAKLTSENLQKFADHPLVLGLAEFMNVPGVLQGDEECLKKLSLFRGAIRDGHAPSLQGKMLNAYLCAGIHGCHESTSRAEAAEKLRKGLHVLVREGSCAKDASELLPLIDAYSSSVMALCSDDRNPYDIHHEGHINHIVSMGLKKGIAPEVVFRVASFGAAHSYGLKDRGVLAPGYKADLCLVAPNDGENWKSGFSVKHVYKNGKLVCAKNLRALADADNFAGTFFVSGKNINMPEVNPSRLEVDTPSDGENINSACSEVNEVNEVLVRVIKLTEGSLLTEELHEWLPVCANGKVISKPENDVLKICVCERHHGTGNIGKGFVRGFEIKSGAIASTIGHDSHNITAVGSCDFSIAAAVEHLRTLNGGICVVDDKGHVLASIALPVGGLMTSAPLEEVTRAVTKLKAAAKQIGCSLHEPFLQLSFLALPVIPALKITDLGLVDVHAFQIVPLTVGPVGS